MEKLNKEVLIKIALGIGGIIFFSLIIFLTNYIIAKESKDETTFPGGCRNVGYSFKYYVLNLHPYAAGKSQSIYFIHNETMQTIGLYQMRSGDEPYVMHMNNAIRPNQWGVYATDEKQVKFICVKASKKYKYGEIVNCKDVLALCEFTNVKFAPNNHGNYWAVGSNSKSGAKWQVIYQGVLLRW